MLSLGRPQKFEMCSTVVHYWQRAQSNSVLATGLHIPLTTYIIYLQYEILEGTHHDSLYWFD